MKTSIKIGLSLGMLLLLATAAAGQAVNSDSWAATDALGRKVREYKNAGDKKKDKFVGIFYLTWVVTTRPRKSKTSPKSSGSTPKR